MLSHNENSNHFLGIGYFTLPFLIHANASFVHACEWNPDAVEALEKNLILNNVKEKCLIHFGDNREVIFACVYVCIIIFIILNFTKY